MAANKVIRLSGIYTITNTVDGKVYVGSAIDLRQRWCEHRKTLRGNRHKNAYLQAAWNRDGEAAFAFSVLLECAPEELIDHEQAEINQRDWNQIYNLNPTAGSQLGRRHSEETRRRLSDVLRGKPGRRRGKIHSTESKQKMSAAHRNISSDTRLKMAVAKLGRKRKPFTVETLRRMSEASKRNHSAARLRPDNCKGKPWSAARRAAHEMRKAVSYGE